MGLAYLRGGDVTAHRTEMCSMYKHQPSWCLRDGLMERWLADLPRNSRILDIGAGSGELERRLFKMGFQNIVAVDLDDYLDRESIGGRPQLTLVDVSRDVWPFEDQSVDVVFLLQMLEHLENPWHCVREALRVTKPGGDIFIAIPHATSFVNRLKFLRTGNVDSYTVANNHVAFFTEALLRKLWGASVRVVSTHHSQGFIRLWSNRKMRFPGTSIFGGMFSRKIAYHLKKT